MRSILFHSTVFMRWILASVSAALLCSFVLLAIGVDRSVQAGTAIRLDIAGLVDNADLALEGRVQRARAVLDPSGKRIDTEYTLVVTRTFLGEASSTRTIKLPGGVLPDGRGMIIPGLPSLEPGEDVILFLSHANASGMRMPVGLAQGKLRVVTDVKGERRLVREQGDLALVDGATARPADASIVLDYAATIARIEAAVAAKHAREEHDASNRPVGGGR